MNLPTVGTPIFNCIGGGPARAKINGIERVVPMFKRAPLGNASCLLPLLGVRTLLLVGSTLFLKFIKFTIKEIRNRKIWLYK